MISDTERREVAARLREKKAECEERGYPWMCDDLILALGYDHDYEAGDEIFDRLADLIDPTCEVHRDALFYPATDLTPEHEETVFRCGKCEEVVSYDEDYGPETDLPAYCERCGSRITGIGEPWD